jgi:LemA protein
VRGALLATIAIAGLALAAGSEFIHVRHQLVKERDAVEAAWLQVDQALARRAEVIPGLEESLEVLSGPAGMIFHDLDKARADLQSGNTPIDRIAANERLSNALARLLVLTENYPKLRSGRKLLRLEEDLEGAENRIAIERRKYNETLEHYNSSIQMFPENIVAALSGFARNDNYFHTNPGARAGGKE